MSYVGRFLLHGSLFSHMDLMKCHSAVLSSARQKGASEMSHIEKTIKSNWNSVVVSKCSCVGTGQNQKIYQSIHEQPWSPIWVEE